MTPDEESFDGVLATMGYTPEQRAVVIAATSLGPSTETVRDACGPCPNGLVSFRDAMMYSCTLPKRHAGPHVDGRWPENAESTWPNVTEKEGEKCNTHSM